MQATCPQCSHRISVDDARAPERPFNVRCPRCQALVRFPGRLGSTATETNPPPGTPMTGPPSSTAALPPLPVVSLPAGDSPPPEPRVQFMAPHARREGLDDEVTGRALVSLPDRNAAAAVALMLTRQGFSVDTLDDAAESARLIDQGFYAVVATARLAGAAPANETLYQRISRLGPEPRRRLFLLLVGDEFKSGDATQAFVALADLVLHSREAGQSDGLMRLALDERQRLYRPLLEARRRFEASAGSN